MRGTLNQKEAIRFWKLTAGPGGRGGRHQVKMTRKGLARSPFPNTEVEITRGIDRRDPAPGRSKMTPDGSHAMELTVNVHFEEGSYWADIPNLPGCFAAGDTLDELFESLREGIGLCLADQEDGSTRQDRDLQVRSAVLSDSAA